jgi:hypothetical protein
MKKQILILGLILLTLKLNSQFVSEIGTTSGISTSKIDWVVIPETFHSYYKSFIGFSTSFYVNFFNHKYWSISTRIDNYQVGGKINLVSIDGPGDVSTNFVTSNYNYFDFKPTIKIKVNIHKIEPYLYFGPRIDYLYSSSSLLSLKLKTINYGPSLGMGIAYNLLDKLLIIAEFSYNKLFQAEDIKVKNNILVNIGLGYKFK